MKRMFGGWGFSDAKRQPASRLKRTTTEDPKKSEGRTSRRVVAGMEDFLEKSGFHLTEMDHPCPYQRI
jgi:hypothetical protein